MVARIVVGSGVKGMLNYNEHKVQKGDAELLMAKGYHKSKDTLSFNEKLTRFDRLMELNETMKRNSLHISLNFDPAEELSNEQLNRIAETYMDKIGFGDQPFLVYRHHDAGHPHIHIVTTNVQISGKGLSLHNIGKHKSEPARKEIEQQFGLVKAQGRNNTQGDILKPLASRLIYGKQATKAALSNVVRAVVRDYKFGSLAELNAVLKELNVIAYRGEAGSRQYERKGLSYCMLDEAGNKVGVPIKSSSIYTKPTLAELEKKFEANTEARKPYRDRIRGIIDKTLSSGFIPDKEALKALLAGLDIGLVFRQNDDMVYGITYIDHKTGCVFNGSTLGKAYSAKRILERIGASGFEEQLQQRKNKNSFEKAHRQTDYNKGASSAVASLYAGGLRLRSDSKGRYFCGKMSTKVHTYHSVGEKLSAYFILNGITGRLLRALNEEAGRWQHRQPAPGLVAYFESYIKGLLSALPEPSMPIQLPRRKKRKRKPNW